jgi:peptidyl-dipeptidase Dcp
MTNPLLQKKYLTVPTNFSSIIKDEHFKPAFEYGQHDREIKAITDNKAKANKILRNVRS